MILRPYQENLKNSVYEAWADGARAVAMILPTGGGKTAILAKIAQEKRRATCVIAHRHEIVAQLSLALARYGVTHNIVGAQKTIKNIANLHVQKLGRCWISGNSPVVVASVDTLIKRTDLAAWAAQVELWVVDEGHHLVHDNKWHTAISLFSHPHARGLLPTATPERADRKGLGSDAMGGSGFADTMVSGPPMRWLVEEGYLTDYRVVTADSHMGELLGEVGASGDWSSAKLKAAAERSPIVGDVVGTYRKWGGGGTGIVFAPDVGTAGRMLDAYRSAGVRVELVTGETDPDVRARVFGGLETGRVQLVVAVDVVSEGTDVPALQVGIFARATMSQAVYMQQFGRVLRPIYAPGHDLETRAGRLAAIAASVKPAAIIIDHVGNFLRHGPPDRPRAWSLADGRNRRGGPSDAIPMRACLNPECARPYERYHPACPYCGTEPPPPAERSSPAMVDGDMCLLDAATLAALRGEIAAADVSLDEYRARLAATGLPPAYVHANAGHHANRQAAQGTLRHRMDAWCGPLHGAGWTDRQMQRAFFLRFGVDMFTAQALRSADADALAARIELDDPTALTVGSSLKY